MSSNFQCEYCEHYFSSRNGLSQHINRCISSTEEFSDIASSINDMSLDSRYFEQINELQIIREEENLSKISDTDCMQEILPENFELGPEPEPESFQGYEPEPESIRSYEPEPESIRSYEPEPESIRSYEQEPESIRSFE